MDLVLDTCAIISIAGSGSRRINKDTQTLIQNCRNVFVSSCSLFEIAQKYKKGNLALSGGYTPITLWNATIDKLNAEVLSISAEAFYSAVQLPDHHNDPFDRIIIAQAIELKCGIVTYDKMFDKYSIPLYA